MKIFVTGAAGFIGSHLVDRLISEGYEVIGHDNLHRGKIENIKGHIDSKKMEFWEGDVRSFDHMRRMMKDCDIVFHLAAQSNVLGAIENMDYSFESNVMGTFNVLRAAQENKIKRLIFSSSREAYGEPTYLPVDENHPLLAKNLYGASKIAGEKYVQVFKEMGYFETVILRFANVYGERDYGRVVPIFINNVKNNESIKIFGGKQIIDFVSIEIVVDALLLSIENEKATNGPINVGTGMGSTLFDLAKRIRNISGSNSEILVEESREAEVQRFTSDTKRFYKTFRMELDDDPLYYLDKMNFSNM